MYEWIKLKDLYSLKLNTHDSSNLLLETINKISLQDMIEFIINDSSSLQEIANNSIHHDNGFFKIVLLKGSTYCLRLHYWSGIKSTCSNIHNHRWNFSSLILFGSYLHTVYDNNSVGLSFNNYNYKPEKNGYFLTEKGKVKLSLISSNTHHENCLVRIHHDVLHKVQTTKGMAIASLVVTEPPFKDSTSVLTERNFSNSSKRKEEIVTVDELTNILTNIRKKLIANPVRKRNVRKYNT